MRSRPGKLLLVCLVLALIPAVSRAQTTGQIEGTVFDSSGSALPGVTVEISSPSLQGTRTAVTSVGGTYRIPSLPPGNYRVRFTLQGFGRVEKQAQVRLDRTAKVDVTLQVAATEQVVVSGEAPLIDTSSTTGGTTYTAATIARLPLGRNYTDIVKSNPGVMPDRGDLQGRSQALTVYGSTSAENSFIIDGVNTTNVIRGFQGKVINNEFIQEVEVKTDSYKAEYGSATGGIVNVITKSGGNDFHGDGFVFYDNNSLRSNEVFTSHDSNTATGTLTPEFARTDFGADLGGFFIKDRLWFFGAYDRISNNAKISPPRGPVAGQSFGLDERDNLWSGKLTWNVTSGTTIVGTSFSDPSVLEGAVRTPNSLFPATYEGRRDIGGTDYGLRANVLFGSMGLLTAQASRHEDRYQLKGSGTNAIQFVDRTVAPPFPVTGGLGRINGFSDFNSSKRDQYRADFTAYIGDHEAKIGGSYVKRQTDAIDIFTGGQLVTKFFDQASGLTYYQHTFFAGATSANPVPIPANNVHLESIDYSAFLQDTWKLARDVTIDVGLRWDRSDIKGFNGATVARLNNEWQPRVGVIWDPSHTGQSKVYGFVGRFYYELPTDINVRDFGAELFANTWNFDPVDTTQDPTTPNHPTAKQQGGAFNEPIDKNIKGMYEDELTIGVEHSLSPSFSVGIKGMYKRLGRAIDDRCDLDYNYPENLDNTCANINPGGSGQWASGNFHWCDGYSDGGCYPPPAPATPDAKRLYRAIQVTARKSFGTSMWFQASYIYSSLRGNYDGAVHESTGQTDPGLNSDFDYPATYPNSYGKLFLDRPHQFRLDAAYTSPFGLYAGFQFYLRSGVPLDKLNTDWADNFGSILYLVPRGSAGRTPMETEANLSLGYAAHIGPLTLSPEIYIFNLFNRQSETYQDVNYYIAPPNDPNYINPDYGKVISRTAPRLIRFALKASF
jgi:Carboxypeptidase regulatory-like domain/TonB-dependent Receptor Plug Domain